jgi:hypothetical protein
MATSTRLSLLEYMETSYQPDREFIDGELLERNVGKWEHARLQALLAAWLQSDALKLQFEAVSRFDPESKKVVQQVLDSMILQQEARRWSSER